MAGEITESVSVAGILKAEILRSRPFLTETAG